MLVGGARALAAAALAATLAACDHGSAPGCHIDSDCDQHQRCEVTAGICVGFATPLLDAPDSAASDGGTDG